MGKVMTLGGTGAGAALILAAALAFPVGSVARAETGAWAGSLHAKVRLVSAVARTGGAKSVQLGLEIVLEPGWKTYWRAPGEGGMPPRFDWGGSANLAKIDVAWPAPKRFAIGGLESVGYSDRVILPLDASLAQPGEPVALRLMLHYAVCREICMLVEAKLVLDLPSAAAASVQPSGHAAAIARYRALVPRAGAEHGWRVAGLRKRRIGGTGAEGRDILVIDVASEGAEFVAPQLMVECPGVRFGKPVRKHRADARVLRFVAPMQTAGTAPDNPEIVVTIVDGTRAGEFRARLDPAAR